ncbi:MAG: hypothetical protein EAZ70_03930 [Runella slithyformis]|nr:MAG: hypothetical protein EAY79_01960 [Runella slithyformis]TAF95447.1 MAG: hypothetical protein EAZ46_07705 [Runella sp.]TAG21162.1 MAG: hypothetical protein EAZ38_08740 [Cytophagales bacterium]TAG40252.1 MAG: hypothetical protein EAZ32_07100 [Cytophagia bacterium]TAF02330.1 MAG: hypothetical protein EAZ80_01455 [Runella slithyformis]
MSLPKLFYVCINNGSDTRINKEIKTLSRYFEVYYLGIGSDESTAFVKPFCKEFWLIKGHHKQISTLMKYFLSFIKYFFSHKFASIHVINEQLLFIFFPFLWLKKHQVVADIFDSIFLRSSSYALRTLQKVVYALPKRIIVTDDNRKNLVSQSFHNKLVVVENYPYRFEAVQPKIAANDELLILYSGSLGITRGTNLLARLVELSPKVQIWMVGWLYDEPTRTLSQHPQVKNWGVVTQQESMHLASQCDYILSVYEPINDNNLNASPNKIYDAVQAQTPVIINREVKIADFVEKNKLGYVIESFYEKDHAALLQKLIAQKKQFVFDQKIQNAYTWEAIEAKLVAAHQ